MALCANSRLVRHQITELLRATSIVRSRLRPNVIVSASGSPARGSEQAENDMNEPRERKGPNLGLLLLIPAAVIIAKGASRRRAQWRAAWGGTGGFGPRHGHHGQFGDSPVDSARVGPHG